jgi:hypothetical protein
LAADYGISTYLPATNGVYVNLFLPSKLTWMQGGAKATLTQTTNYPTANTTVLKFDLAKQEEFTVYLRVPAWADSNTRVSVNGKRVEGDVTPGKFMAVSRTWKNGDRIEYEMGMPLRLLAVDPETPQIVAAVRGPVALFGVGKLPASFTRAQLLSATPVSASSSDLSLEAAGGKVVLRPFGSIGNETYRLYHKVDA